MSSYTKEKVIKVLDKLIEDIENVEHFNIKEMIDKYLDLDEHDKAYLPNSIEAFGDTYDLFKPALDTKGWFKLTKKGIKLKEYGNGLNKFERKLERRFSPFEKASIFFIIITFLFGVYQNHKNNSLENRVQFLENQLILKAAIPDTLKTVH